MHPIKFIAVWVWLLTTINYTNSGIGVYYTAHFELPKINYTRIKMGLEHEKLGVNHQVNLRNSEAGGSVLVKLNYFHNLGNRNYKGLVCDPCNYQFSIWVTCDGITTGSGCLYGMEKTKMFYNKSGIAFTQDLGNGSRNPLVYNFTSFQGNLGITILATNQSGAKIEQYGFHQSVYPTVYGKKRWTNSTLLGTGVSNSNITLSYQVHCKEHYYSPSCTVGCLPGPNYKCDEGSGKKLCLNSYVGPNCTCKAGHQYNCDPSTGKRICHPPWHGVKCDVRCREKNDSTAGYKCNSTTGAKICLYGWYGAECNETTRIINSKIIPPNTSPGIISTAQSNTLNVFTTKNSIHYITPMSIPMMSLPTFIFTSYALTSSSPTSSPMTSPLIPPSYIPSTVVTSTSTTLPRMVSMTSSIMTSPLMTSPLMTSSPTTSHLFTSLIAINSSKQELKPFSSYIRFTGNKKLSAISVDSTATSGGIKNHTGKNRDRTKSLPLGQRTKTRWSEHKKTSSTCCDVTSTPTPRDTTFRPGSTDARKDNNLWWLMLLPFVFGILLIITAIRVFKRKNRNRREISPNYEASMQELKVKPPKNKKKETPHDQQDTIIENNNQKYPQEDLEAIWKVMSTTFHE